MISLSVSRQQGTQVRLPLLVLDLCFHIIDGVGGLDLQSNGFAGEGLYEDLHAMELG